MAAVVTGPLVGGWYRPLWRWSWRGRPAVTCAPPSFLTGSRLVHQGEWLALIGLLPAATTLVVAVVIGLFQVAATPPTRSPPPTDAPGAGRPADDATEESTEEMVWRSTVTSTGR